MAIAKKDAGVGSTLAVQLDPSRSQPGETMATDGRLPGEKFFDSEGVARACLFERQEPAAHSGHNLSLATDHPPFGNW